jgi:hypothetical protein
VAHSVIPARDAGGFRRAGAVPSPPWPESPISLALLEAAECVPFPAAYAVLVAYATCRGMVSAEEFVGLAGAFAAGRCAVVDEALARCGAFDAFDAHVSAVSDAEAKAMGGASAPVGCVVGRCGGPAEVEVAAHYDVAVSGEGRCSSALAAPQAVCRRCASRAAFADPRSWPWGEGESLTVTVRPLAGPSADGVARGRRLSREEEGGSA